MRKLTRDETERYARQMLLPEWGGQAGQRRLAAARVVLAGVGAVGCAAAQYLAAAGVGRLELCDGDAVSLADLNRQVLFGADVLGRNKAAAARDAVARLNGDIEVVAHETHVDEANAAALFANADLVCCAVDESEAKREIGCHAFDLGIPVIMGGTTHMAGFVTFIDPPATPCMECILGSSARVKAEFRSGKLSLPEEKQYLVRDEKPVPMLGASAGTAGAALAMEGIKFIVGFGVNLMGMMLQFDMHGAGMNFNLYDIDGVRAQACPRCGSSAP